MSIQRATPYLFFNGDAAEAIAHYSRTLGAEARGVMRYADMPADVGTAKPEDAPRVMHAMLRVGEATLFVSDIPHDRPPSPRQSNVEIALDFDDQAPGHVADMDAKFAALAEGGSVTMALHDAFWGGRFGALVDKFGIRWMFTSTPSGAQR